MRRHVHTAGARRPALGDLGARLKHHIRGQDHALTALSDCAIRAALDLTQRAPRCLLLGPTGVGKTEAALALSAELFQREPWRFDMSEFQRPESLEVLLGNRNGDRGRFGSNFRHADRRLQLLDEIEKAHPKILDLLLQMLEPGHVSLSCGERCDLSQFLIVCTSNIATADLLSLRHLNRTTLERHVIREAERVLRSEIVNRFDLRLLFNSLDYDVQLEIAHVKLEAFVGSLRAKGFELKVGKGVMEFLMRHGFNRWYGARPLCRAIQEYVGAAVAKEVLACRDGCGLLEVDKTGTSLVLTNPPAPGRGPL